MSSGRNFIGPFQLIRTIRAGNSTTIWEAINQSEKKKVALKILATRLKKSKKHIEELKHEVAVGKSLEHEHVIQIYDYHGDLGAPMLSMELFNARNLKIVLREHHEFVGANIKKIIRRCGEGLTHMHEQGWLHCDVKPDNFLCDINCELKLIDFSIAEKSKKRSFNLFGSKAIRGTRSYMAPEQIRRQTLSPATDIYGLGCMMYELASGRTPYSALNPDDLLKKHLTATAPSLEANSGATQEYARLVSSMLAKKQEDRPTSVKDVVLHLNQISVFRAGRAPKKKEKEEEM